MPRRLLRLLLDRSSRRAREPFADDELRAGEAPVLRLRCGELARRFATAHPARLPVAVPGRRHARDLSLERRARPPARRGPEETGNGVVSRAALFIAAAHIQPGEASGFITGFLHPISGLDHVIAMIAVGLWG